MNAKTLSCLLAGGFHMNAKRSSFSTYLNWISLKARNIPRHFPILFLMVLLLVLSFLMLSP